MPPPPINVVPHSCVSVCVRARRCRDQAWVLARIFLLMILKRCLWPLPNMIIESVAQPQCHRSTAMALQCSLTGKAMRKMSR